MVADRLLNRHSIRLQEYDYSSSGMYFVTRCTQNKLCLFGEVVEKAVGAGLCSAPKLGNIIIDNIYGQKIWQRNYFEHIIRNEKSYNSITDYIATNPINWQSDDYFIRKAI